MTKTALELIQQGWTQGTAARDKHGVDVSYFSDDAVCWCAAGAINAAYENGHERYCAILRLNEVLGNRSRIASWNDDTTRTKEDVIEAFVKARI